MIRIREHNAEVYYAADPLVQVDRQDVEFLVAAAAKNPRRRIRLCAHPDVTDSVHEMLIVHFRDCYVRPHKHLAKSEAFHIILGSADVVLLDEAGLVSTVVPMGEYGSGRKFYYRLAQPVYHTLLIQSDYLVFHEITTGPFQQADTIFLPGTPELDDTDGGRQYLQQLKASIQ